MEYSASELYEIGRLTPNILPCLSVRNVIQNLDIIRSNNTTTDSHISISKGRKSKTHRSLLKRGKLLINNENKNLVHRNIEVVINSRSENGKLKPR